MKLRDIPSSIAELNQLAENKALDQLSLEIMASNFYLAMQTTVKLDASYLSNNLNPAAFILMAQIAANSPILHTLDIRGNGLYNFDSNTLIVLADAIANSPTLHTFNIGRNFLRENMVVVVESLLKSSIRTADIRWNCIQEGINKKAIITLIEARNQEVLEWKEALKFLGTTVGALRTEGEVANIIRDIAFSTHEGYLTEGELFTAFYNDDSCVIN
jgi:hypothetical protein